MGDDFDLVPCSICGDKCYWDHGMEPPICEDQAGHHAMLIELHSERDRLAAEIERLSALVDASDDPQMVEHLRSEIDRLAAENEALHKRIRGLAVDSGVEQTDDAVEDVRRGIAALREIVAEVANAFIEWEVPTCSYIVLHVPREAYAAARAANEGRE